VVGYTGSIQRVRFFPRVSVYKLPVKENLHILITVLIITEAASTGRKSMANLAQTPLWKVLLEHFREIKAVRALDLFAGMLSLRLSIPAWTSTRFSSRALLLHKDA
jgi:hypothetical protein